MSSRLAAPANAATLASVGLSIVSAFSVKKLPEDIDRCVCLAICYVRHT